MKIRTLAIFVFLAMLIAACVTVEVPPEVAEIVREAAEPAASSAAFDSPNSCFHMTLNEAVRKTGGEWDVKQTETDLGYYVAFQSDLSTGTLFSLYAEDGPDTRVDTVTFLWDFNINDDDGEGGGQTYDFLDRCGLSPEPLMEVMEACEGTSAERSDDGCRRNLDGFDVGISMDDDGIYIVTVMDW